MLLKVVFPSTMELDTFIGQLQKFGRTSTQIVFSTPVAPRGIDVNQELPGEEIQVYIIKFGKIFVRKLQVLLISVVFWYYINM